MLGVVEDDVPLGPEVFVAPIPVRWSDMDADGHVNNVAYLRFIEEARMLWAGSLGLPMKPPGVIPVVKNIACRFDAPMMYPCALEVAIHCSRLGKSSLALHYALRDIGTREHYAIAFTTWVWIDSGTSKSVEMPQVLRAACEAGALAGERLSR